MLLTLPRGDLRIVIAFLRGLGWEPDPKAHSLHQAGARIAAFHLSVQCLRFVQGMLNHIDQKH